MACTGLGQIFQFVQEDSNAWGFQVSKFGTRLNTHNMFLWVGLLISYGMSKLHQIFIHNGYHGS